MYRVFGDQAYLKGGFATTKAGASRQELALLSEWNNSMRFEASVIVPQGQVLNIGKVASQTGSSNAEFLAGGGDQILLPQNWNYENWSSKIVDKHTGKEYTFAEFQTAFPNIIAP